MLLINLMQLFNVIQFNVQGGVDDSSDLIAVRLSMNVEDIVFK